MATKITTTTTNSVARPSPQGQAIGGIGFDWEAVILGTWLIVGGYSDGWAHNHLPIDNFFTPWHGAFYSGFLAAGVLMIGTFIRNRRRGYSWQNAMPAGYELSLLGVLIIFLGGIGDMFWHILFGIELNIDGALSPTHIAVSIGLALIVCGPFRAAWERSSSNSQTGLFTLLPMILSITYTLSTITIISQFSHPFVNTWPSYPVQEAYGNQALAVAGIALQTIILMGWVLLAVRRWALPFGAITIILTINTTLLSFMQDHYLLILVTFAAGLVADVLIWWLKPSAQRVAELRLFGFTMPIVLYLFYFLALYLTSGINWTIHLWLGTTVLTGIIGFMLSYLTVPPAIPAGQER